MPGAAAAFDESVSFDYRRIDLEDWTNVYVIGDVHGCLEELERLLSVLEFGEDDLGIFVGDLVRKGPESTAVLDRVSSSPSLVSVLGNNEQKLLAGEATVTNLGPAEYRYLEALPVAICWDGELVVHGGVDPNRPLSDHTEDELLTMRAPDGDGYDGPFWFDEYRGPRRVFFGHTVLDRPFESEWAVGLDTGCVYGGRLTAYDVGRSEFVSVPAHGHVDRSPANVVTVPEE